MQEPCSQSISTRTSALGLIPQTGVQGQDAEPASKVPPTSIPSFRGTEPTSSTQNSHIASKTRVFVVPDRRLRMSVK
jgi:hypothetical protein